MCVKTTTKSAESMRSETIPTIILEELLREVLDQDMLI